MRMPNDQSTSRARRYAFPENLRNSLRLNYESPALTAELQAPRAVNARTSNIQRATSSLLSVSTRVWRRRVSAHRNLPVSCKAMLGGVLPIPGDRQATAAEGYDLLLLYPLSLDT